MTFKDIPILNVLGKKGRSVCLLIFAALLSFSIFGGTILLKSLKKGLSNLELRLGADVIAVPYEARTKSSIESILLQGNRTYFYMNKNLLNKIAEVEGVEKASPQFFLSTISAGCCSVSIQIIGFDPQTDFTIQPWAKKRFSQTIKKGDILVGSKVNVPENKILKFYGIDCNIVCQLEETGTGLDNAVYTSFETIDALIESAKSMGIKTMDSLNAKTQISSVMIKVKDGYTVPEVADYINLHIKKIVAVRTKSMTSGIANSIAGFSKIVSILIVLISIFSFLFLSIVFSLVINERKKEFAILRLIGASQKKLAQIVILESFYVTLTGALCGIIFASILIFPFGNAIKNAVSLPFLLPSFFQIIFFALEAVIITVLAGFLSSFVTAKKISTTDAALVIRSNN